MQNIRAKAGAQALPLTRRSRGSSTADHTTASASPRMYPRNVSPEGAERQEGSMPGEQGGRHQRHGTEQATLLRTSLWEHQAEGGSDT